MEKAMKPWNTIFLLEKEKEKQKEEQKKWKKKEKKKVITQMKKKTVKLRYIMVT